MEREPCIYILANRRHGTTYVGVTSNLMQRLHQHRSGETKGFSTQYGVHRLVYFERFDDMPHAIAREKQLKNWKRDWKIALIEAQNPEWHDLAIGLGYDPLPRDGSQ